MNILFEFGHFLLYKISRTKRRAHLHNIALHLVNVADCLPRSVSCVRQWAHSKSRAETVVTCKDQIADKWCGSRAIGPPLPLSCLPRLTRMLSCPYVVLASLNMSLKLTGSREGLAVPVGLPVKSHSPAKAG